MRAWDSHDAYLFDIDGTLLHCQDAVHYFGFLKALKLLSGRSLNLDGVTAHGNTDLGIIRDALGLAGLESQVWLHLVPAAMSAMEEHVKSHEEEMVVSVIDGVRPTLESLHARGVILGVATGNIAAIGRTKLRLAGLTPYFTCGAFSDGLANREDVFKRATDQIVIDFPDAASICIVGDTPRDVEAAHACGLPVIAVATGIFTQQELASHCPDHCVGSLLELLKYNVPID